MISPTRGSFCFHDGHSNLPVSSRCWPPAPAPSWSSKMMFTPRHAEQMSDACRCVSSSCGSVLCCLQYSSTITPEQGRITVDTIYPATEKHVSKHSAQSFIMVSVSLRMPASASERASLYAAPANKSVLSRDTAAKASTGASGKKQIFESSVTPTQMQEAKQKSLFSILITGSNAGSRDP